MKTITVLPFNFTSGGGLKKDLLKFRFILQSFKSEAHFEGHMKAHEERLQIFLQFETFQAKISIKLIFWMKF